LIKLRNVAQMGLVQLLRVPRVRNMWRRNHHAPIGALGNEPWRVSWRYRTERLDSWPLVWVVRSWVHWHIRVHVVHHWAHLIDCLLDVLNFFSADVESAQDHRLLLCQVGTHSVKSVRTVEALGETSVRPTRSVIET
jgi:hypothetical protein